MSHLHPELRRLPPTLLSQHTHDPRPIRHVEERAALQADVLHTEHHTRPVVEIGAATGITGLLWGVVRPSGSSHAPALQWAVAVGISAVLAACIGAKMHRASRALGGQLERGDVATILSAAALGLFCGRQAGNTIGSLIGLMRF